MNTLFLRSHKQPVLGPPPAFIVTLFEETNLIAGHGFGVRFAAFAICQVADERRRLDVHKDATWL